MEKSGCKTKTSKVSLTNILKDIEKRISGPEGRPEEIDILVKENAQPKKKKSKQRNKKTQEQSIQ